MGNTGVPGVWLFHIGNAYNFHNVIPAAGASHVPIAVPRTQVVGFQTTPEYPAGDYETDDEPEYRIDPDFQNPDVTDFPQPGQDGSVFNKKVDSNPFKGDVTLSPEPQTDHTAPTNVSPEEIIESVHPVTRQTLLEAYPIHPQGQVVNVDEVVNFNSGGEAETVKKQFYSSYTSSSFFLFLILGSEFQVLLKSHSCSYASSSVTPFLLPAFKYTSKRPKKNITSALKNEFKAITQPALNVACVGITAIKSSAEALAW